MTSVVLDASAVLALLFDEPGAEFVAGHIPNSLISAANYAEILAKAVDRKQSLAATIAQVGRLQLSHWPFDAEQAATSAALRESTRAKGLSLADRACLSLALTRSLPVLTGDRRWKELDIGITVELIR